MIPEIERLLILQERDTKLRALRKELQSIPTERSALQQKLSSLEHQAGDARQRQRAAEVEQARLDTEIKSRREQISKYEVQKLQTRKNEEYQALSHSIEHVRREISGIEDRQIELMEQLEALKPEVAAADRAAKDAATQVQNQMKDLDNKHSILETQAREIEAARPKLLEGLDEDLLDTYERLFANKGQAVVGLAHEVCSGCHMKVTISTAAATRAGRLIVQCENCNRILYLEKH